MANLKFRYSHDNPYNEDMEQILNRYGFVESSDDDEGIEYEATISDEDNVNYLCDYFSRNDRNIVAFQFIPYSRYGWGFNDEVMTLSLDANGNELEELYMPIEDFIDMFDG